MKKIIALVMTLSLIFMVGCSSNSAKNTEDILNKDQKEIEKSAKGSTVNFYGWGGNEVLNKWFVHMLYLI
ncbi:extracellular solute-binding family 1 domain protein [[Clostridium] sordellii ATCC 9714]|nr:extracellular solute-binding family 1 domain protein [[Clostridium] sordellii ATCC 9714] [Paeniclostridium sordellii ATCC 9714]